MSFSCVVDVMENRSLLVTVQLGVFFLVLRPVVVPALFGDLNVVDEFDVRTLVDFIRVAAGVIRDEEPQGTTLCLG